MHTNKLLFTKGLPIHLLASGICCWLPTQFLLSGHLPTFPLIHLLFNDKKIITCNLKVTAHYIYEVLPTHWQISFKFSGCAALLEAWARHNAGVLIMSELMVPSSHLQNASSWYSTPGNSASPIWYIVSQALVNPPVQPSNGRPSRPACSGVANSRI